MNIPTFAQPFVSSFKANGNLGVPTERLDFETREAQGILERTKDEFASWQSLDETDADLAKGIQGEVRIQGYAEGESTTATFSGNTLDGQLTVHQNEPTTHYGWTHVSVTQFHPMSFDKLDVLAGDEGQLMGPELTHIDHQLSSDGPISLGGGPVSVTLTDHAKGGYLLFAHPTVKQ